VTTFAELTTLRVGGPVARLIDAASPAELIAALTEADSGAQPVVLLGGGSNTLAHDDGASLVLRPRFSSISATNAPDNTVTIEAEAGTSWADLVDQAVAEGWSGFEALAGIPGSVGAAPIQNIGAYGHEVSELISHVTVWDRTTREERTLTSKDLAFSYRSSALKQTPTTTPNLVVLSVTFTAPLTQQSAPIAYAELAQALGVSVGECPPSSEVKRAVMALRASKGMVLDQQDHDTWSAGSFFTNPVIPQPQAAHLPPDAPCFPAGSDPRGAPLTKVSAAWLMTNAGIPRGWGLTPRATTSTKHVLALTNRGGATAQDIRALAAAIQSRVHQTFAIPLTPEPTILTP